MKDVKQSPSFQVCQHEFLDHGRKDQSYLLFTIVSQNPDVSLPIWSPWNVPQRIFTKHWSQLWVPPPSHYNTWFQRDMASIKLRGGCSDWMTLQLGLTRSRGGFYSFIRAGACFFTWPGMSYLQYPTAAIIFFLVVMFLNLLLTFFPFST